MFNYIYKLTEKSNKDYISLHQPDFVSIDIETDPYIELDYEIETDPDIKIDHEIETNPEIISKKVKKNSKMLNQISMDLLCWKMFSKNMNLKFIFNIIINILLSSMLIPTIFKLSNDSFVSGLEIEDGKKLVILAIGFEILSTIHKNQIIEPYKRIFVAKVHSNLEDEVNKNIPKINWDKLRNFNNNDLDRKKSMAKFYILGLITPFSLKIGTLHYLVFSSYLFIKSFACINK